MKTETVLIDDDPIVRLLWEISAEKANVPLVCYASPSLFLSEANRFPKDTPIYIDVHLGGEWSGPTFSKTLADAGYTNLYLATGMPSETLELHPWIKGIVGKTPPF